MKISNHSGDLILLEKNGKNYNLSIIKYVPDTAEVEQRASIKLTREELLLLCSEMNDVN